MENCYHLTMNSGEERFTKPSKEILRGENKLQKFTGTCPVYEANDKKRKNRNQHPFTGGSSKIIGGLYAWFWVFVIHPFPNACRPQQYKRGDKEKLNLFHPKVSRIVDGEKRRSKND